MQIFDYLFYRHFIVYGTIFTFSENPFISACCCVSLHMPAWCACMCVHVDVCMSVCVHSQTQIFLHLISQHKWRFKDDTMEIYWVHFEKPLVFSFEYLELTVLGVSVLPSHSFPEFSETDRQSWGCNRFAVDSTGLLWRPSMEGNSWQTHAVDCGLLTQKWLSSFLSSLEVYIWHSFSIELKVWTFSMINWIATVSH